MMMKWAIRILALAVALAVLSELMEQNASRQHVLSVAYHMALLMLHWESDSVRNRCQILGDAMFTIPASGRRVVQEWVARLGGLSITTRVMNRHMDDPDMMVACARWFCSVTNFNRFASLYVPNSGAIELLMEVMDRFPYHAGVQGQAPATLGCSCDFTPETEAAVVAAGAPKSALRALATFPSSTEVQFLAWAGLSSMCNALPIKHMVVDAGAVDLGMMTMRDPAVRRGFRVRQEVIMTFCTIAAGCERCVNEIVASGDIVAQVMQAMDDDEGDQWSERGTKTDGIQLMMELAAHNRTNRLTILKSGFLNYTLRAMMKFPQHHPQNAWPLSELALRLLISLAEEEEGREAMHAAGAVDTIGMTIAAEPTQERQTYGVRLLDKLLDKS